MGVPVRLQAQPKRFNVLVMCGGILKAQVPVPMEGVMRAGRPAVAAKCERDEPACHGSGLKIAMPPMSTFTPCTYTMLKITKQQQFLSSQLRATT